MPAIVPPDVSKAIEAKYDWLKREQFPSVGKPDGTGIYRNPDGGWQQWFGNWASIAVRPGETEPHEVHGAICNRWAREGGAYNEKGVPGWLGYPVSDEEVYDGDGDPDDRISHFEHGDIVWAAKTGETRIVDIKDRARWYESRRNGLLGLLREAADLDLPEQYAEQLRGTMRKCQEDAFEIALVGEFQGGKSTTFNALCDGRDISPRGIKGGGIKTSAALISAQNVAGEETKDGLSEWAEVTFMAPSAIALGISTILRPLLVDSPELRRLNAALSDEEYADAIATDDSFPDLVDLGNPACLELLRRTADHLWEKWEKDKAHALDADELDQLRIATLQLRFFGTHEHARLLKRTTLPIDEFQKVVAFPNKWEPRWRDGRNARFEFGEIAFVFVHSVLVRLHSENLRRLGCRITDCPGLFANAFDTSVAEKAIRQADAVWYLIGGERQLGDKDKRSIQQIAAWGLSGKIQATANIRTDWEYKSTEILGETQSILENMGLAFEVIPYNARLAFLAVQGKLLLEAPDKFGALDRENMRVDAGVKEDATPLPSEMWPKMVKRIGTMMDVGELENIEGLDAVSVGVAREASHFGEILARLESDVIPQKAQSVLVFRGSDRAAKALTAYEGVLQASERAASAEETKWRAELEKARGQLADFIQGANKIIDRSVLADGLRQTVQALGAEILALAMNGEYVDNLSVLFARKVLESRMTFDQKQMLEDLKCAVGPGFVDESKNAMSRALESWKAGDGLKRLRRSLEFVCEDIHALWEERRINASEMLEGFETPTVSEEDIEGFCTDLSTVLFQNQQMVDILKDVKNIWKEMVRRCMGGLKDFLQYILAGLDGFFNQGSDAWTRYNLAKDIERNRMVDQIASKSRDKIENAVNDVRFREKIGQLLEEQLEIALGGIGQKLRARLDALEDDFEKERVAEPEKMFGRSEAERQRIAGKNKAIRTETIMPLRKRIEAFKETVTAELGA